MLNNEQWLMLGAAAGNFLLLLFGYIRSGKKFQAHYLIDALTATIASWPTVQAIGFMPSPETAWWKVLLAGIGFGLGLKVLVGKTIMKPIMQQLAEAGKVKK